MEGAPGKGTVKPELEVERPLLELEQKIKELKSLNAKGQVDLSREIAALETRALRLKEEIYQNLSPWDRVRIARHLQRPSTLEYVQALCSDFMELHGDRLFSDDRAMVGGFATFRGKRVMVLGHQKGGDTKENLYRNFGMASPEGFRKAARLMRLAEKFSLPLLTFIDTPGAYPGIGAEERGQFVAIAENLKLMSRLKTPVVVSIIGEGGSGGALGIAVGDRVLMLEHAVYSVISPEGCASILWRDGKKAPEAAQALHLTSEDCLRLGIVDEIIQEPLGGAHHDPEQAQEALGEAIERHLHALLKLGEEELLERRYAKFRSIGYFMTPEQARTS